MLLSCNNCSEEMVDAEDNASEESTDVVKINITCVCGHVNQYSSLGYPRLAGVDKYYFEFTDEFSIECRERKAFNV